MRYQLTEEGKTFLSNIIKDNTLPDQEMSMIKEYINDNEGFPLSTIEQMNSIIEYMRDTCKTDLFLNKIVKNINIPPLEEKPPSEELIKRREYLKRKQEEREYNQMVSNIVRPKPVVVAEGHSYSNYYAIGLNSLIAVFVMFFVGYYIGVNWLHNIYSGLILGLLFSIVILFTEMILFMSRSYLVDYEQEKKKKEE